MAQMGHENASLALEVYAKKMQRNRDTGARVDALLGEGVRAETGSSSTGAVAVLPAVESGTA